MKPVKIYTTKVCPYCIRAKALLQSKNVPYEEIMVDPNDEAVWEEMEKRSGMKTVPQIFIDGKCVGGYTDIAELDQAGKLNVLLGI